MESNLTGAVRARQLGDEYQHRYFWIEACRLFTSAQNVARVGIEIPLLRAFDDVVTTYRTPLLDVHGRRIVLADHYQLKFHLRRSHRIRGTDLVDPAFINARSVSLLERAHEAVTGPNGAGRRLALVTPWDVDDQDPLARIVERNGGLDLDELFDGGPRSAMGRMRNAWRARLGDVDDDALRETASHLWFWPNKQSVDLDRMLDNSLASAGLAPVDYGVGVHRYVALAQRFVMDNTLDHDADALEAVVRAEGLRVRPVPTPDPDRQALGIKSFEKFAYPLEDEADVLNLVPDFHGRYKRAHLDWDRDIAPKVGAFLGGKIRSGARYDLYLDCHISIGYLAGYELGKADADVGLVDRRTRQAWRPSGIRPVGEQLDWHEVRVGDGPALALAFEATRRVEADVRLHALEHQPLIGRILVASPRGGPSPTSVRDADHAAALAADITELLERERSADERRHPLHMFFAGPVQLAVLLGIEGRAYGRTVTYEYDFPTRSPGAYSASFHLPPPEQE